MFNCPGSLSSTRLSWDRPRGPGWPKQLFRLQKVFNFDFDEEMNETGKDLLIALIISAITVDTFNVLKMTMMIFKIMMMIFKLMTMIMMTKMIRRKRFLFLPVVLLLLTRSTSSSTPSAASSGGPL